MIKKYILNILINIPIFILDTAILFWLLIVELPIYLLTKEGTTKQYIRNQFISVDQDYNSFGFGSPDETISSRIGRNYPDSLLEKFVNWLFKWQKREEGHCVSAIEHDEDTSDAIIR